MRRALSLSIIAMLISWPLVCLSETATDLLAHCFAGFGAKPDNGMHCVRTAAFTDHHHQPQVVTSFKRNDTVFTFAGFETTEPFYDYHNDVLFRIRFHLKDVKQPPTQCLQQIRDLFTSNLGMELISEDEKPFLENITSHFLVFQSSNGLMAQVIWQTYGQDWDFPAIKIQRIDLINQLNAAMNPRYVSKYN